MIHFKKLTEYALNPNHPVGRNKAKVFESALGYNQSNADDLMRQIYEKLPSSEAVVGKWISMVRGIQLKYLLRDQMVIL